MTESEKSFLNLFEESLQDKLHRIARQSSDIVSDRLPETDDVTSWWKENAPTFMEDAVREFNSYPTVVLAWAGYLGMAVARLWDRNEKSLGDVQYRSFYGPRGFDEMDEYITEKVLGYSLKSKKAEKISDMLRTLANETMSSVNGERVEYGTVMAFQVLARSLKVMYLIGAAMELTSLGYSWQKMKLGMA